jgi:hypothetical protein
VSTQARPWSPKCCWGVQPKAPFEIGKRPILLALSLYRARNMADDAEGASIQAAEEEATPGDLEQDAESSQEAPEPLEKASSSAVEDAKAVSEG